jgi:ribosome maturation factor RimP
VAKATAKQKQAIAHAPQFSPQAVQAIQAGVLTLVDSLLPDHLTGIAVEWLKEGQQWILRVAIERKPVAGSSATVSLDECAMVSRLLDAALDTATQAQVPIPEACIFSLELSSPGLFRTLATDRELSFYTGATVTLTPLKTSPPAEDPTQTVTGQLLSFTADSITVQPNSATQAPITSLRNHVTLSLSAVLQALLPDELPTP